MEVLAFFLGFIEGIVGGGEVVVFGFLNVGREKRFGLIFFLAFYSRDVFTVFRIDY